MFLLFSLCCYLNLYFSTVAHANLSPLPLPPSLLNHPVRMHLNFYRCSLCSLPNMDRHMIYHFILFSIMFMNLLIFLLLYLMSSVKFAPYNIMSVNQPNNLIRYFPVSTITILSLAVFIDSIESLIILVISLSDIYSCDSFTAFVASAYRKYLDDITFQAYVFKPIFVSFSFWFIFVKIISIYGMALPTIIYVSYYLFMVIIISFIFTLLQSIQLWLILMDFIFTNDMIHLVLLGLNLITDYCVSFFLVTKKIHSLLQSLTIWLILLKIARSNDVEKNPGDFINKCFTFCNWNINSLAKDSFYRIQLLEAHNSLHSYDLISICETSLNDTVEIPDKMLENYNFVACNNPNNVKHGGVGLFYKDSLSIKIRSDLAFDETIVVELMIGRKKIFFTVLYRSPSKYSGSPEFKNFLSNFENLYANIKKENPYATFFTGDFNGHSEFWWKDGDTNAEGKEIEELTSLLGLKQFINEPTNFEPNKNSTCIDLVFTDQPNIVMDSGIRPSLDNFCHHQIIFCNSNLQIPPSPPYKRKIWHYGRADVRLIKRAVTDFPWERHLSTNPDPNWQVESFTQIILNIMTNFIPNEIKTINPREPPWLNKPLKSMLKKQNRLYQNFKKHGYKNDDRLRLDIFSEECKTAVAKAKNKFVTRLGNNLADPNTSKKAYWKIINKLMNKCKASKIPPILVNNKLIINCIDKAKEFAYFFSNQCKLIINNSTLPVFNYVTEARIDSINIEIAEILSLIQKLDTNKANGPDEISCRMLLICDNSIVLPLKIIFNSILITGIYPAKWKSANVIPIHKKANKQDVKNYRPISLLPICAKIFEKIVFKQLYSYFVSNNLITKNQSGFRSGDSTINQLIDLCNVIYKSFDEPNSYEVRAIFLDISKAFDKVWHEGLIYKLKQNGVCGSVLEFLNDYLEDRHQRVVINGYSSKFLPIEFGVLQRSLLGPLLFLIYIDDLEKNIKLNIKFFADDTMLFSVVHDPLISANEL